ncbi:MAG: chloride channel protein [Proteobacteria bacterium]|nr:chloride channel protein [Pseudomonadota bacterium]
MTGASVPPPRPSAADPLPVSPGLGDVMTAARMPRKSVQLDKRVLLISTIAILLAATCALIAQWLTALIGIVTNFAFYGRWSTELTSPAGNHLGAWVILVPVVGGLIVGAMARWGSAAIRGHGIPEAMEQVLLNQSRIPPRITFLKPVSSAVAIGTGGPFGAEGPIIATGGALGSLIGQLMHVTAIERKTLLAAGAAAGMAAVFGSPISAVILAVELLLFELRPRSLIPVALAATTATGIRYAMVGSHAVFAMPQVAIPGAGALLFYVLLGAALGFISVGVTRAVYAVEDAFDRLPIHWMWWPALGGLAVGVVGFFAPLTLGVGYTNIEQIVSGGFALNALMFLCAMKFLSWVIALGSGTSGGTLAPLFTIGGALGAAAGMLAAPLLPRLGIDPRIAGLVGMAAMFAGASRAVLASIVFAFETTLQPAGLLPLLGGCSMAYLVSCLCMRQTIMTEKIARRGVRVPSEYAADYLDQVLVRDSCSRDLTVLNAADDLGSVRRWLASGDAKAQFLGYPVLDQTGNLRGIVTRRQLLDAQNADAKGVGELLPTAPIIVFEDNSLREAADHMVEEKVGSVAVVTREAPQKIVGVLTRGDLVTAHTRRLSEARDANRQIRVRQAIRERLRRTTDGG